MVNCVRRSRFHRSWYGPAATRIALSARIAPPIQGALAAQLGTTEGGTAVDQLASLIPPKGYAA